MAASDPSAAAELARRFRLDGKAALVCGASQGIGLAIAQGLAEAGAVVTIVGRRAEAIESVVAQLRAGGADVRGAVGDMAEPADVRRVVGEVLAGGGVIDVLVNVVGMNLQRPLLQMTDDDWRNMMAVNLDSAFYTCRELGAHFLARGGGCVINVASTAGLRGRKDRTAYCAAKAGVINFSRALAVEWAEHNIRVNVLCPGRFSTPATVHEERDPAMRAQIAARSPMRRIAQVDEVKATAVYLAADASSYATGAVLALDGGQTAL